MGINSINHLAILIIYNFKILLFRLCCMSIYLKNAKIIAYY